MLTKILFTIVVIAGVAIFYRQKAERENAARAVAQTDVADTESAIAPRTLAYIIIGLLVSVSIGFFIVNWQQDNRVVNIRVTAENGEVVT